MRFRSTQCGGKYDKDTDQRSASQIWLQQNKRDRADYKRIEY